MREVIWNGLEWCGQLWTDEVDSCARKVRIRVQWVANSTGVKAGCAQLQRYVSKDKRSADQLILILFNKC